MPAAPPPNTLFPTEERFVNLVREAVPGTIPAAPYGTTMPMVNLQPEDKPLWLLDESLRGGMGDMYDMLQGPMYADVSVPASPVYNDVIGHPLYGLWGDYTQSAPAATPNTTTTAPAAAGATTLTVTSGTSFTVGMWIMVFQTGSTGPAEIVQVLSGASTTITLQTTTPLRFSHNTGCTVTNTSVASGTYSHSFSLLTSGYISSTSYLNFAQPPTHCWTDRTQVPSFGGTPGYGRQYAYGRMTDMTITGNAEKLLEWNGKFVSYVGQIAPTLPVASVSSVRAYPDFNSTVQLATTSTLAPVYDITEWSFTATRQVKSYFTNSNMQNPFAFGAGKLGVTGKLTFSPATDETALLYMLNNTQPQLEILTTNGLASTSPLYEAFQLDILYCDFDTSKINDSSVLFGYDVTFKTSHTAATRNSIVTTGWSGGYSAAKVAINNAVPIF